MKQLTLIKLADVKDDLLLFKRGYVRLSRIAEILNECANEALHINEQKERMVCPECKLTQHKRNI